MPSEQSTYIRAGWLIDGTGSQIRESILLTIQNGKFTAIDRFDRSNAPPIELIADLSDCTILPPLIDSHVHLALSGQVDPQVREHQRTADYTAVEPGITRRLRCYANHGVFAVRDGGDRLGHALRYKIRHAGQTGEQAIVKASGRAWYARGRYGSPLGRHPAPNENLPAALARDSNPVDQIKIIQSGPNSLCVFGKETPPQFSRDEIGEVVRGAMGEGAKVMVHANGMKPVRMALEAGCHSIEHGFFMGRENLRIMAEKKIFWVPTAFAMQACAQCIDRDTIHACRDVAGRNLDHQLEQIAQAVKMGIPVALGTDSGSPGVLHGEAVIKELRLLIQAGYSLTKAIRCASANGAALLDLNAEMGTLARGMPAHFIAVRCDPASLLQQLSHPDYIYINGSPRPKNLTDTL